MCRDKEQKHREMVNAVAKADRVNSLQSMCASLESEVARLRGLSEWQVGMIERAKRLLEYALAGHTNDGDIECVLADLEKCLGEK